MIKKFSVLLIGAFLTISCSSAGSDKSSSDKSNREPDTNACGVLGLKIINGTSCSSNKSAVVRLIYIKPSGGGFACTGTLIAPNKVLTAAHCVYADLDSLTQLPDDGLRISSDTSNTTIAHSTSIAAHPLFGPTIQELSKRSVFKSSASDLSDQILSLGFPDVAVVTLDRNLSLPTLPVYTSRIPDSGEIVSIFGFGLTTPGAKVGSANLVSGEMDLERNGKDNFTAIFGSSGSNTCQGDSGGPALLSPSDDGNLSEVAVTGITSLGFGSADNNSCTQGEISVFTAAAGAEVAPFIKTFAPNARFL